MPQRYPGTGHPDLTANMDVNHCDSVAGLKTEQGLRLALYSLGPLTRGWYWVMWVTPDVVWVTPDVVWVTPDVVWVTRDVVWVTHDVVWVTPDVVWVTPDRFPLCLRPCPCEPWLIY